MKVTLDRNICMVEAEPGDPKFRTSGWAYAESTFLYHVKKELEKRGHNNLIKKRMWKDGHMVDEKQQYLRTRKFNNNGDFCILNGNYSIYDAGLLFNERGWVELSVVYWQDL